MLSPQAVVLAFGDSLTYGTGASAEQSYPGVLAALLGRDVVNSGVPGETTPEGLRRLPNALDDFQPELLVLCHGGNDLLRKLDLSATEANLAAMVREAQSRGIAVVLIGVPEPGLFLGTADLYERVAQATGVPIEDEILSEVLGDNRTKSDPIHPNAAGYRLVAEALVELLRARGAL